MSRPIQPSWAYCVTTCPARRDDLLPRTLQSLARAGFDRPHLFVDGDCDGRSWSNEFGLDVTARGGDPVRTYGHWTLSIGELYLRNPKATHFAVFQDDLVTYPDLKEYLSRALYPERCYLNLYTFPSNGFQRLRDNKLPAPPDGYTGFYASNQRGRGAVGLVFRRQAVIDLFSNKHMAERPLSAHRGHKAVDGGIVTALGHARYKEYVHNPTLVFHTGNKSTIEAKHDNHLQGIGFKGEDFSALNFLK